MPDDERATEQDQEPLKAVPDLKGACVIDANGHVAGELFGSLAEVDSGLIRYLDLALNNADKHVLVPIGHARIDRKKDSVEVQLRAATREELRDMPEFTPAMDNNVRVDHDQTLGASTRAFSGERYYAHPAFNHKRLFVGDRPVVSASTAPVPPAELAFMSDMEFELADDHQDVRDWPVQAAGGEEIGVVEDLVIDTRADRVRYLRIRIGHDVWKLLPVGYANLDAERSVVCTPELEMDDLRAIPDYTLDQLTRVKEAAILAAIEARLAGARRFKRPDFSTES